NRRFFEYTGLDEARCVNSGSWHEAIHPEDLAKLEASWTRAQIDAQDFTVEARIKGHDDSYRWFLAQGVASRNPDGSIRRWLVAATDINDQKLLAERQSFLADVSTVLNSSLDVATILQRVTEYCVPRLADWCQVQVLSIDDELLVEAVSHRDPDRCVSLERLLGRQVVRGGASFGSRDVLRHGSLRRLDHVRAQQAVRENVPDAIDRRIYERAGLGNALIVPLLARGQALGTLHLVNISPDAVHSEEAAQIAEELARLAAIAIDNSRLYQREHRVATALQQAMLPTHLPDHRRIEFSSVYRPAEREAQLGGDWYDAFPIADDKIAISIGDVGGHGLGAAVAMSEARQALRLSALEGLPPSEVLRRANAATILNDKSPIITAIFGIIDLTEGRFTYSSAGHPPPILSLLSGETQYLSGGGVPMGAITDASFPTAEVELEPYSALVLYTDGLIEFTRKIDQETERLLEAVHRRIPDTLAGGAEALLDHMLTSQQHDDIAILIATYLPATAQTAQLDLQAVPQAAAITRRLSTRFARAANLSMERTFVLNLAVGEAVANAVEHAYRGEEGRLSLRLSMDGGRIIGEVRDEGQWREGAPVPDRGRGLTILHAITSRIDLERTKKGTRLAFEI
ncbi:MAG TPA: SpoIIE family protein phosphatase, partial [Candidatus Acidoferrales bacterium]|nr:SpoIIE family protein phosphatase [Candidatus Acidoferrales bacterium]